MKPFFLLSGLLIALAAAPSRAQTMEDQGRAIFDQHQHAVVTIQLTIKQKFSMSGMPSQEEESKAEVTGTVINAEGLTVVALSTVDPTALFRNMMDNMNGREFNVDSTVDDVRILMHDGKEVPSQIILRDVDLDLAFVRPVEKPQTPFEFVNLEDSGTPQLLDAVVTINRLSQVANRVYSASFERISAIVKRPRTFYIPGDDVTTTENGSPAFTLNGKIVGVFVLRSIRDTGGGRNRFGRGNDNVTAIILPAADILDGVAQAPAFGEEPVGEPKPEATPEDKAPADQTPEAQPETPEAQPGAPEAPASPDAPPAPSEGASPEQAPKIEVPAGAGGPSAAL